jgi:hypothetical protein
MIANDSKGTYPVSAMGFTHDLESHETQLFVRQILSGALIAGDAGRELGVPRPLKSTPNGPCGCSCSGHAKCQCNVREPLRT